MTTLAPRRQKNITLKEYIHNNSLRKRLSSRNNSREKSQLSSKKNQINQTESDINKFDRDNLLEQIKLFLADNTKDQKALTQILKMINRLVELYNRELYDKQCQKGILESMINMRTSINNSACQSLALQSNQKRNYLEPVKLPAHNSVGGNIIGGINKQRKNSIQSHHYRKASNASSEEIPNINVLLMTRNEQLFDRTKDQQTEETLFENNHEHPQLQDQSKISIQFKECQSSFMNNSFRASNAFNQALASTSKKEGTPLNTSAHSTHWKNNSAQSSALSRFEYLKKRMDK